MSIAIFFNQVRAMFRSCFAFDLVSVLLTSTSETWNLIFCEAKVWWKV